MAAAAEGTLNYRTMKEAGELRQWVEANPGRVNGWDGYGNTPLSVVVGAKKDLPLALWLLDEKGADVNATTSLGWTALHAATFLEIFNICWTVARISFCGRNQHV
jgi:hypothetical protein